MKEKIIEAIQNMLGANVDVQVRVSVEKKIVVEVNVKKGSSMATNLKLFFVELIEKEVFPFIDRAVAKWDTPLQLDDQFWAVIRERLQKHLDALKEASAFAAFPIKAMFISFLETVVFPIIDEYVKSKETTWEWDDKAWAILKSKVREYVNSMEFVELMPGHYEWTKAPS